MTDDIQVPCPRCEQLLMVAPKHLESELECPQCRTRFIVPDGGGGVGLSDEDIALLQRRDADVVARLEEILTRPLWRYGILAGVLSNRMQLLRKSIYRQDRQQGSRIMLLRKKAKMIAEIDQDIANYCNITNGLQDMLINHLNKDRMPPDVPSIVACGDVFEPYCIQLTEFHEEAYSRNLVSGDPFQQMQLMILDWVPNAWQSLDTLINHLERASKEYDDNKELYAMSNIYFPHDFPLLHHYMKSLK